ncbi:hypothetical protein Pfo_007068 [Paulownia fortunei]|nr:hypothetical protein Pfo_007068 [Paulownia fortunei]
MSSGCSCGAGCKCGDNCSCSMYPDVERSTTVTIIEGVAPVKICGMCPDVEKSTTFTIIEGVAPMKEVNNLNLSSLGTLKDLRKALVLKEGTAASADPTALAILATVDDI